MASTIQHDGIIVAIDEAAKVRIIQSDACSACRAKSMCLSADSKEKMVTCEVTPEQRETLHVGDKVQVIASERMGWKAVTLAYILPFVVLMIVLVALDFSIGNEALAGVIALCSVGVYYIVLSFFREKIGKKIQFHLIKT